LILAIGPYTDTNMSTVEGGRTVPLTLNIVRRVEKQPIALTSQYDSSTIKLGDTSISAYDLRMVPALSRAAHTILQDELTEPRIYGDLNLCIRTCLNVIGGQHQPRLTGGRQLGQLSFE
jgi:hypothetical protein